MRRLSSTTSLNLLLPWIQDLQDKSIEALAQMVKVGYSLGFKQCKDLVGALYPDLDTEPLQIKSISRIIALMNQVNEAAYLIMSLIEGLCRSIGMDAGWAQLILPIGYVRASLAVCFKPLVCR